MILLWSILIFLTLIASFFSLRTLWHFPAPSSSESAQQHANNAWYLERLDDLEFSFAQQEIDAAAFEQNKLQLQKDFLTFETQTHTSTAPPSYRLVAVLIALVFAATSLFLYQQLGASRALAQQLKAKQQQTTMDVEIQALGGNEGVIQKLKTHLAQSPQDAQGWYLLGRIYFSQNHFHHSAIAFEKAVKLAPSRTEIFSQLAEACYLSPDKNDQLLAAHYLQRALALAPQDPTALNLSALMLYHQGHYQKALAIWQNLLMQAPKDSDTAKALQAAIQQAEEKLN